MHKLAAGFYIILCWRPTVSLTIEHLTPSQSPPFFVRLFGNECEYQVAKIHMPEHGNEHKQESYGKEKREHGFLFLPIFPTHPLPRATVLSMQLGTGRWSMIDPVNSMGGEGRGSMGSRIQPWTLNINIIFAVSFFKEIATKFFLKTFFWGNIFFNK